MDKPVISSEADVDHYAGAVVHVEGRYEQQDVRMMQVGDPVHLGHVALALPDGALVYLYPPAAGEARRPASEIAAYEHKTVRATGRLLASIPQEGAVPLGGCLVDVESIELVT